MRRIESSQTQQYKESETVLGKRYGPRPSDLDERSSKRRNSASSSGPKRLDLPPTGHFEIASIGLRSLQRNSEIPALPTLEDFNNQEDNSSKQIVARSVLRKDAVPSTYERALENLDHSCPFIRLKPVQDYIHPAILFQQSERRTNLEAILTLTPPYNDLPLPALVRSCFDCVIEEKYDFPKSREEVPLFIARVTEDLNFLKSPPKGANADGNNVELFSSIDPRQSVRASFQLNLLEKGKLYRYDLSPIYHSFGPNFHYISTQSEFLRLVAIHFNSIKHNVEEFIRKMPHDVHQEFHDQIIMLCCQLTEVEGLIYAKPARESFHFERRYHAKAPVSILESFVINLSIIQNLVYPCLARIQDNYIYRYSGITENKKRLLVDFIDEMIRELGEDHSSFFKGDNFNKGPEYYNKCKEILQYFRDRISYLEIDNKPPMPHNRSDFSSLDLPPEGVHTKDLLTFTLPFPSKFNSQENDRSKQLTVRSASDKSLAASTASLTTPRRSVFCLKSFPPSYTHPANHARHERNTNLEDFLSLKSFDDLALPKPTKIFSEYMIEEEYDCPRNKEEMSWFITRVLEDLNYLKNNPRGGDGSIKNIKFFSSIDPKQTVSIFLSLNLLKGKFYRYDVKPEYANYGFQNGMSQERESMRAIHMHFNSIKYSVEKILRKLPPEFNQEFQAQISDIRCRLQELNGMLYSKLAADSFHLNRRFHTQARISILEALIINLSIINNLALPFVAQDQDLFFLIKQQVAARSLTGSFENKKKQIIRFIDEMIECLGNDSSSFLESTDIEKYGSCYDKFKEALMYFKDKTLSIGHFGSENGLTMPPRFMIAP